MSVETPKIQQDIEGRKRVPLKYSLLMGRVRVPCEVGCGFGPGEYGIIIEKPEGDRISTIASGEDVVLCGEKEPSPGVSVKGELSLRIHRLFPDGSVQVILPFDSIKHGYTVWLPKELLRGEFEDRFF